MKRSILLLLAVVVVPALALAGNQLSDVSEAGGVHAELRTLIATWLDAVRQRDVNTLVELAATEARDAVRAALSDDHSDLTKILFSGRHSVQSRFTAIPRPHIYLFAHSDLGDFGNGTTGCIAGRPLPAPLPTRIGDLPSSSTAEPIFCQFFYRADGSWHPSYSYGWPNEGGDV
jgi:hypothetical protein